MMTSAQIVSQALQIAGTPGFTAQANILLNAILGEICQTYDFEASRVEFTGNLNPSQTGASGNPNYVKGNGPYALPSGFLRMIRNDFLFWYDGIPFKLVSVSESEFDDQVQQVGIANLPRNYRTDQSDPNNPYFYVYPPPYQVFPYSGKCHIQMPDIGSGTTAATGWNAGTDQPSVSATVPWFPNSTYLYTRLAGELKKIAGMPDWQTFVGKNRNGTGAQDILDRILPMKDNRTPRAQRVMLDKRHFGPRYRGLPDTKNVF